MVLVIFSLVSAASFAQTCSVSELRVLVQDRSGVAISDAKLWLADNWEAGSQMTDAEGTAEFSNPSCGDVVVHASGDGFQELAKTIQITGAGPVEATLVMAPATVQENLEVRAPTPVIEASSSATGELQAQEVKELPYVPATVAETLTHLPGLLRSADGEINISGTGEYHGAFVVNQADVTDPATGRFGPTLPVEVVEAINVVKAPFVAEYGRFTTGIVSVETRRGADKWHAELDDPFPDFRIRSGHMDGLRNSTPRA
jgi:TonB-dependent Receptor Plug Domain